MNATQPRYATEVIDTAKKLYLRQIPIKAIQEQLGINSTRVIYQWAKKGGWDALLPPDTETGNRLKDDAVAEATAQQMLALLEKPDKTAQDLKTLDSLANLLDKLAGIDLKKARIAKEIAHAQSPDGGQKKGRNKKQQTSDKNEIGGIDLDKLDDIRNTLFYGYQKNWYDHLDERTRFILKSRQIGATYYFAWEAFENAIRTGDNQIFLSASKNQSMVFKIYIIRFALEYFDITLKGGDAIALLKDGKPWAELRFVSTNARTAQSYHGHLYIDEVFWIPGFEKLNTVASAMAAHKKWRKTYFSTPSIKTHGAYALWSGEKYNKRRKNKIEFDLSHQALQGGQRGPDKIWRDVVTVKDAEAQGCNLFDITQLEEDYTPSEFDNLFMCQFMEAGASVFDISSDAST